MPFILLHLLRAKHFCFYEAQLTNFFFFDSCFLCPINKSIHILSYKDFHLFSSRGFVSLDFIWVPFIYLSAYFWLHWVFVGAPRLSLVLTSGGCALAVIRGLLGAVASLAAAHGLQSLGSVVVVRGLRCSTARVILFPGPGIEPVSPTLADRLLTARPPGKSPLIHCEIIFLVMM